MGQGLVIGRLGTGTELGAQSLTLTHMAYEVQKYSTYFGQPECSIPHTLYREERALGSTAGRRRELPPNRSWQFLAPFPLLPAVERLNG
jgi:hypothetical protein